MSTLPDQVEAEVRTRILRGELGQGTQIRQGALAATLGTSRIPVWEALARMEREGVLVHNHNRGFEVRWRSRSEMQEIYDLRSTLEPEATAEGAMRADEEERSAAVEAAALLDAEIDATSAHWSAEARTSALSCRHIAAAMPAAFETVRADMSKRATKRRIVMK